MVRNRRVVSFGFGIIKVYDKNCRKFERVHLEIERGSGVSSVLEIW